MIETCFKAIEQFDVVGNVVSVTSYGNGHINNSFLVVTETITEKTKTSRKYILQKINDKLFTDVDKLMSNISQVTDYVRAGSGARGFDPDQTCLSLVKTRDGKPYLKDEDGYHRVFLFIDNSVCYQVIKKPEDFFECAVAFGNFISLLSDFDASRLYDILPDFHNTQKRYQTFLSAVEADKFNRARFVSEEINFVKSHSDLCSKIVSLIDDGKMPVHVIHNDTKLNNVLFDKDTDKAVAVVDLDTVMQGSICYDFGDAIRCGCNPCEEDEADLTKVAFDFALFKQFTKGFLYSLGQRITQIEKENLVTGALVITLECGMRFLTDYLQGDTYFKTSYEQQNLNRARTQFKMLTDMCAQRDEMEKLVDKYYVMLCL